MRIEICQPDEPDNTTGMHEVQVDGEIRGRFRVYCGAERFADELVADLPSAFAS